MEPRQVTVFGGSGFIGRHLTRRLAARGMRVVVAVRDPEAAAFLKPLGDVGQIAPRACDVRDARSVAAALAGSDAAVNLVGILYETRRRRFADHHATAPATIARAAAAAGARAVVHVSALGADARSPSAYARSKAAGETALRSAFPGATILRPSVVFGPEDEFFNRFAALLRLAPAFPLFGGGTNRFQPVYVCDVADAILRALVDRSLAGRTLELGGPRIYTMREVMELILSVTGRRRLLVPVPMVFADVLGRLGDVAAWLGLPPTLTSDQARLLRSDNVVADNGFAALGIRPTAAEVILPNYLDRFRPAGRYTSSAI